MLALGLQTAEQRSEMLIEFAAPVVLDLIHCSAQSRLKTLPVKGFEQIVHRMNFKSLQGKFIVSRDEYYCGQVLPFESGENTETIQFRHLDIQKNEIRRKLLNGRNGFLPIGALAENRDVRFIFQKLPHALSRQRLIVDEKHPGFHVRSQPNINRAAPQGL